MNIGYHQKYMYQIACAIILDIILTHNTASCYAINDTIWVMAC